MAVSKGEWFHISPKNFYSFMLFHVIHYVGLQELSLSLRSRSAISCYKQFVLCILSMSLSYIIWNHNSYKKSIKFSRWIILHIAYYFAPCPPKNLWKSPSIQLLTISATVVASFSNTLERNWLECSSFPNQSNIRNKQECLLPSSSFSFKTAGD